MSPVTLSLILWSVTSVASCLHLALAVAILGELRRIRGEKPLALPKMPRRKAIEVTPSPRRFV